MIRLLVFGAIVMMTGTALAQTSKPTWRTTPQGQLILRPFANAPYPHASRANGFKGSSTTYPHDPHYVDSTVGIFIPRDYVPGESVTYVVHFHGHENHVSKVIEQYKLSEQIATAKVNAILLVPQGPKDAADSGGGKLELDAGGFAKLIEEVTAYLISEGKIDTHTIGKIAVSAHSGGYKVLAAVLHLGGMEKQISDVLLFDASYGDLEWFADWCNADPSSHRLVSLFTDDLADANQQLMALLDKAGGKHQTLEETNLTSEQFQPRGVFFMLTKGPHDQVPLDYFGRLLATSALAKN